MKVCPNCSEKCLSIWRLALGRGRCSSCKKSVGYHGVFGAFVGCLAAGKCRNEFQGAVGKVTAYSCSCP